MNNLHSFSLEKLEAVELKLWQELIHISVTVWPTEDCFTFLMLRAVYFVKKWGLIWTNPTHIPLFLFWVMFENMKRGEAKPRVFLSNFRVLLLLTYISSSCEFNCPLNAESQIKLNFNAQWFSREGGFAETHELFRSKTSTDLKKGVNHKKGCCKVVAQMDFQNFWIMYKTT